MPFEVRQPSLQFFHFICQLVLASPNHHRSLPNLGLKVVHPIQCSHRLTLKVVHPIQYSHRLTLDTRSCQELINTIHQCQGTSSDASAFAMETTQEPHTRPHQTRTRTQIPVSFPIRLDIHAPPLNSNTTLWLACLNLILIIHLIISITVKGLRSCPHLQATCVHS